MTLARHNALCLAGATLVACQPLALRAQSPAARVIASSSILADMAQDLAPAGMQDSAPGRPRFRCACLPAQPSPAQPSPADGKCLAQADLVLINGLGFEGWIERMVNVSGLPPHSRRRHPEHPAAHWRPPRRRSPRLAGPGALDFLAPQGWNTQSEPSAAAVARLIRQIKKDGVRAIFIENISDPSLIERIAREGGARIGGTLYSDALSKPDCPASTYLRCSNTTPVTLAAALQA